MLKVKIAIQNPKVNEFGAGEILNFDF